MQSLLRAGAALGFVIYVALLPTLVLRPTLGLRLLWFLFIPLAPMFLLAAPNAWVSICPISTVQTLARRFGWNGGKRLSPDTSRTLQRVGWILMFVGIPSRHLIFNSSGPAVLAVAAPLTVLAFAVGVAFYSLSGWSMGACPIRPVEVLYGQLALDKNRPEKCTTCTGCVGQCIRLRPEDGGQELARERLTSVLTYGFPGVVAAYFLLDLLHICNTEHAFFGTVAAVRTPVAVQAVTVYGVMALGFLVSFVVLRGIERLGVSQRNVIKTAAVSAYAFYYLGVVPEIGEAWSLGAAFEWIMVSVPFVVLAIVLFNSLPVSSQRLRQAEL